MLVVKPVALVASNEKLTPVGVGSTVSHRKQTRLVVLENKVFVWKSLPEDTQAARTVSLHKIAALDHEVLNDAMERAVLVPDRHLVELELPGAQLPEVLRGLRHDVAEELHLDATNRMAPDRDVEEHHRVVGVPLWPVLGHLRGHGCPRGAARAQTQRAP